MLDARAAISTRPQRRLGMTAAAAVTSVLLLAACGGDTPTQEPPNEAAPTSAEGDAATTSVDIVDNAFEPSDIEVEPGAEVTWENTGNTTHTVTFEDGEDSGNLDSGATYSRTFDESGDYPYVCSIHPGMAGTVTVAG